MPYQIKFNIGENKQMINKLEKANTGEITTLFSDKYSFTCKMRYIARKDIKEYHLEIFKMAQEAIALAPAFAGFIAFKEAQLGKESKYFNELEKYQALDEFKKMYYKANELLNKGIQDNILVGININLTSTKISTPKTITSAKIDTTTSTKIST